MFGFFVVLGVKIVGILCLVDGLDIVQLCELVEIYKFKLYVINLVLYNLILILLLVVKVFQVLCIVEEYDFIIVEDDIYCDMYLGFVVQVVICIVVLDQLQWVIYLGGFFKMLLVNLCVGFIVILVELVCSLVDCKLFLMFIIGEIGEWVVYWVFFEGYYCKYVECLCVCLNGVCDKVMCQLECMGMEVGDLLFCGMFLWVDIGCDINVMIEEVMEQGFLLVLGSLFLFV